MHLHINSVVQSWFLNNLICKLRVFEIVQSLPDMKGFREQIIYSSADVCWKFHADAHFYSIIKYFAAPKKNYDHTKFVQTLAPEHYMYFVNIIEPKNKFVFSRIFVEQSLHQRKRRRKLVLFFFINFISAFPFFKIILLIIKRHPNIMTGS